jgi:hypothetical protein
MWIRWYPIQWLHSTCRDELEPAERATFQDFVCLAAISATPGKFKYTDEEGLARQLKTPAEVIRTTIKKCEAAARIIITRDVEGYYFEVVKWGRYQVYLSDEEYRRKVNRNYPVNKNGHKNGIDVNKNEHQNRAEQSIAEQSRENRASPDTPYLTKVEEIFKAAGYNFDQRTVLYIAGLCAEFPELNHEAELKSKMAWWVNHPLTKKSNVCLQVRNWFVIAAERIRERQAQNRVGAAGQPDPALEAERRADYARFQAEYVKAHGLESVEEIDLFEFPSLSEYWQLKASRPEALRALLTPRPAPASEGAK